MEPEAALMEVNGAVNVNMSVPMLGTVVSVPLLVACVAKSDEQMNVCYEPFVIK